MSYDTNQIRYLAINYHDLVDGTERRLDTIDVTNPEHLEDAWRSIISLRQQQRITQEESGILFEKLTRDYGFDPAHFLTDQGIEGSLNDLLEDLGGAA